MILMDLLQRPGIAAWRERLALWVESGKVQKFIIAVILTNGLILGFGVA